jgi:hypothetical protein
VAAHGAVFGRRLARLAEAELGAASAEEAASFARRRRSLQKLSLKVSWMNLAVSAAVMALAATREYGEVVFREVRYGERT